MKTAQQTLRSRLRYHPEGYLFLVAALRRTQQNLGRSQRRDVDVPGQELFDERAHVSGQELLEGIRDIAQEQFGLLARVVFRGWGIHSTEDFGRMVFEMIERGEMRKTDSDQLSDFVDVYDFVDAFERGYRIDVSRAF